jgi:hypothetical protein
MLTPGFVSVQSPWRPLAHFRYKSEIRTVATRTKVHHAKENGQIVAPARVSDDIIENARKVQEKRAASKGGVPVPTKMTIRPPDFRTGIFTVVGTTPYVQCAFSSKSREQMKATQEAGSTAKKGKKREPKDFRAAYEGAIHRFKDGGYGIPASAFRNGCIDACRMCGFAMTQAKMSVFAEADGEDPADGTPLIRITKGKPEYFESMVRNDNGSCDIRARPKWQPGWEATVRLTFDADQFTLDDVANLLMRVGLQVGIGEGRPYSKNSAGMGWGLFRLKDKSR